MTHCILKGSPGGKLSAGWSHPTRRFLQFQRQLSDWVCMSKAQRVNSFGKFLVNLLPP